jgi:hypothetical protein
MKPLTLIIFCCTMLILGSHGHGENPQANAPDSVLQAETPVASTTSDSLGTSHGSTVDTISNTGQVPITPHAVILNESDTSTQDTVNRFWRALYWGIGAGWTLGKMPLFDEWTQTLTARPFDFLIKVRTLDTAKFTLTKIEAPNSYSTSFPFFCSISPIALKQGNLSATAEFQWMKKKAISRWQSPDSLFWHRQDAMSILALSLGCLYHHELGEQFFKVDGVLRSMVTCGFAVSPLVLINHHQRDSSNMIRTVHTNHERLRGAAVSWKAGVATFQGLASGNAVEIGIMYEGAWQGLFPAGTLWREINPAYHEADFPLAFVSNRFRLYAQLLITRKKTAVDSLNPLPAGALPVPADSMMHLMSDSVGITDSLATMPILKPQNPVDSLSHENR